MNKERKKSLTKCYQAGSLLLVMLFLSISVVQAFHSHNQIVKTEQSGDQEYVYTAEPCDLCNYYTHQQGKDLYLSYPPVLIMPIPDVLTLNTKAYIGNYKFTLQGFTNKGPPALSC